MEDSIDSVFLNAVHEDGQVRQRTPLEVKVFAEFQQGALDGAMSKMTGRSPASINSRATYDPMKPAPPVMRVVIW